MWSRKYDKCIVCGTTERKYCAKGMCRKCYEKKWAKKNPEKCRNNARKFRESEKGKISFQEYRKSDRYKEIAKKWRNSERGREYQKEYNKSDKMKEWKREYCLNKKCNNPHFKLRCNISTLIGNRLRFRLSSKGGKSIFTFLPYSIEELMVHLESLFTEGMTWDNWERFGWHIDHKIPDCNFNYKNVEDKEFQECWALKNLRPLWWHDNLSKGGKIL